MRRHKKLIIAVALAGVLLFASLGGVALAADPEGGGLQTKFGDFITKVCDEYDNNADTPIDREALQAAIDEVRPQMSEDRAEMRAARAAMRSRPKMNPEAMQEHLDSMLARGVITEEQAEAFQKWLSDKPEDLPFGPGFRGHGRFPGKFGPCAPPAEE